MRLRELSDETKLAISTNWLKRDRARFTDHSLLVHGLNAIEAAHNQLRTTYRQKGTVEQLIAELTSEITTKDAYHDRKARGAWLALGAGIELADSDEEATAYADARDLLYPNGMLVITFSYRDQRGTAEKVRERITPEIERALSKVQFDQRSLLEEVNNWLASADLIGEMVSERAVLIGDADDTVSRADVHAARLGWIGAVNDLLRLIKIARVDAETERVLLADLREAERKAASLRARQRSAKVSAGFSDAGASAAEISPQPQLDEQPESL